MVKFFVVLLTGLLWSGSAVRAAQEVRLSPADAVDALKKLCIDTGAVESKALAILPVFRASKEATALAPSGAKRVRVVLKSGLLDLEIKNGVVQSCSVDLALSDPMTTFLDLQKLWFLGGRLEDHDSSSNEWVEIAGPNGKMFAATFSFVASTTLEGAQVGRMNVLVRPAAP